jgi:FkbM family methyltransferase
MVRDDVIFDIGMHRGGDTAYYLAKGFNVVGFEADPEHASHCRTRFADAIRAERLTIVEGAIAPPTERGRVTFYKNITNTFQGTTNKEWSDHSERRHKRTVAIEVPRVDVAEELGKFGIPYYLKSDIEGADKLVLEALASFTDRPPYLSFEAETLEFPRLIEELDFLRALGYRKFRAVQQKYIGGTSVVTEDRFGNPLEFTFETGTSGAFGADLDGWQGYDECRATFIKIFRTYRWFGRKGLLRVLPGGRQIRSILRRTPFVNPLPGWYDTHAALA